MIRLYPARRRASMMGPARPPSAEEAVHATRSTLARPAECGRRLVARNTSGRTLRGDAALAREVLGAAPLFRGLLSRRLEQLLRASRLEHYASGEAIVRE